MKKIFVIAGLVAGIVIASCSPKTTPPPAATTTAPTGDVAAGKDTYVAKCQRCHELKNPGDFNTRQWVKLVDEMAPKAHLDDAEKANVLAYVQANAKQ
jgi:mono/diheme cytochrome c family protein